MPLPESGYLKGAGRPRIILLMAAVLAVIIFIFTYIGIQKSRSDSLELLRQQGVALIGAMTLSADNAIKAGSFFDLLVEEKFSDLAGFLESRSNLELSSPELADFASGYGVDAIIIFDSSAGLKAFGARGVFIDQSRIYAVLAPEVDSLFNDSSAGRSFQIVDGERPGEMTIYYLSKAADQKHVIAIVSDALFYSQAKESVGIGYLVRNIAREVGIEYILFQTTDGIIFSSRKIDRILKIEKDEFLQEALARDTVCSREYVFNDRRVLELVKRFSSTEYPEGLFRLGISLEKYYDIIAGFDRQMIVLSLVLFAVLVILMLYLVGKQKRIYLDRSFRQMKSLSESVFDSINAGLISVTRDGTVEMANNQLLRIFEMQGTDITGRRWDELPFRGYVPIEKVLDGRENTREDEAVFPTAQGSKYLLITTGKIFDQKSNPTGAVAVVYDYTRLRELEGVARRKERLSELGNLAAGVAHEIRNPLNAISIAAQRLIAEFEPKENTEEFQMFARQIKTEANRLNEIVTRFLSMAKGQDRNSAHTDFSRIVTEMVNFLSLGMEDMKVSLEANVEPGISVSASEDRLKQLAINLIKNAVEACESEGGQVSVRLYKTQDKVCFEVSDTGPGIPENLREKIFSPYFSTKEKGTGLGLSIVHQITSELGGNIELVSSGSKGATFRVSFPRK